MTKNRDVTIQTPFQRFSELFDKLKSCTNKDDMVDIKRGMDILYDNIITKYKGSTSIPFITRLYNQANTIYNEAK